MPLKSTFRRLHETASVQATRASSPQTEGRDDAAGSASARGAEVQGMSELCRGCRYRIKLTDLQIPLGDTGRGG